MKISGLKISRLKISTQLRIGFSVILILVLIMGLFTYMQTLSLHKQTEDLFNHPLKVRIAIKDVELYSQEMRLNLRNLLLTSEENKQIKWIESIADDKIKIDAQLDTINDQYLGPQVDLDNLSQSYMHWLNEFDKNFELVINGKSDIALSAISENGKLVKYSAVLYDDIKVIEQFASHKAIELYENSIHLNENARYFLIVLIMGIFTVSATIAFGLQSRIHKPLTHMNNAVRAFHGGDLSVRSQYDIPNEFGELSQSINLLADLVESNMNQSDKKSKLSEIMMQGNDPTTFFTQTLSALSDHIGAQTAAVYLLSANKEQFDHFISIGLGDNAKKSFNVSQLEGVLAKVLITKKISYIADIVPKEDFQFNTEAGKFVPYEMVSIPIITNNEVTAILMLSSIKKMSKDLMPYLESIYVTLSSRVEGVLAYRKIKEIMDILETQNQELTQNKIDLSVQTMELTQQNVELEMQKRQLNESSQMKTNFLSNMSHELRTPLNSVIALSGVLSRRLMNQIPEEEYGYLEVIERNGKNLLMLINDILDISRIEAGHEEVDITQFNIVNLTDEIVTLIKPQTIKNNIEVSIHAFNPSLMMKSDEKKCRHILQNLIGNAIKFTENGSVNIVIQRDNQRLVLRVKDTGIGISQKDISHIFEEFRQGDGSASRKYHGTGLGLAIAKKYADLLGGTITVNSELGEGSEFTLYLPLEFDSAPNEAEELDGVDSEQEREAKFDNKQSMTVKYDANSKNNNLDKTILLVEDNEGAVIQVRDLVDELGSKMIVASNGIEALKLIKNIEIDAIILDLMMPGMGGIELLEMIRNEDKTAHVPVLVLTAKHITKDDLKTLKRNNIHQLIQKGDVDRYKLQESILAMLGIQTEKHSRPSFVRDQKPLVLIVEDNPDNMLTVKAMLGEDYATIEAVDGPMGIEMAKKYIPNLILMDIALPGLSGIDAYKEINSDVKLQHIPVIALTASAMIQDREAILSHGFDAFIAKPIIANQFYAVIDEVLYGK